MAVTRPNVVVISTDDLGWGDVGCFGAPNVRTPNLDRMAAEGTKLTNFYAGAPVCTPSRASLVTGCYPQRVGLEGGALQPGADRGLDPAETTIGDVVGGVGGATACIGKWHLGDHERFLPTNNGFDSYFGLPYSNDMHPDNIHGRGDAHPPLPLLSGTEVVEREPDQSTLTRRYTEAATAFVHDHADDDAPFLCYLAHTMPHVPLACSERFEGRSPRGRYGDVVEEIDWSVGRVLDALAEAGIDDETLVVFTSDHGPWLSMGERGGSSGPLDGGKFSVAEGGPRVATIARWPGEIPAATTCTELVTGMDLLPTVAALVGADHPDRTIDGEDVSALLRAPETERTPRGTYLYSDVGGEFAAVRDADGWKLHREDGTLYDLYADPGERRDLSDSRPEVANRLRGELERFEAGFDPRPPGRRPE